MIFRWKISTRTTSGAVTSTEAAMIEPHEITCSELPENRAIATGTVRAALLEVKVSANRYSFHAAMKASSPVVTRAGHSSGRTTRQMKIQGVAPSTIAASSISTGRSRMKVVNTHTVNVNEKIV